MRIISQQRRQDRFTRQRDLAGFAFFLFATLVAGAFACQHPSILAWLYAIHNGFLAFFYVRRMPAKNYDRMGLWLGMIAAFLPTFSEPAQAHWYLLIPGLAGYGLILWSLITLGSRFGIAPADRGLTCRGPYQFIRHPMYTGELIFRLVMAFSSSQLIIAFGLSVALLVIQICRILREEKIIDGYGCYARIVPWRLAPGVW
jgi:protein-S-isoprenylcysteine O-methyltransferase Ste14